MNREIAAVGFARKQKNTSTCLGLVQLPSRRSWNQGEEDGFMVGAELFLLALACVLLPSLEFEN